MTNETSNISDEWLITNSLNGDKKSLETLISRYSGLVYNLSFKMVMNKEDAADIAQEIFIKIITRLDTFKFNSSFSTWLYRIVVNHILNYKKSAVVKSRQSFREFGQTLDAAPDDEIAAGEYYEADTALLVEETKQTCMSAMLLCLDKKHRLVFILGVLLGVNDKMGGEILEVTPENFRMMLSRSKRDLYNFMHDKCGLINKNNPCRCAKKTKAFIHSGFVNPASLLFADSRLKKIGEVAGEKQEALENLLYNDYSTLYQQHSFLQSADLMRSFHELLYSDKMDKILETRNKG
jgi:RNA polymerase sigma factor (sigma-70 family)